MDETGETLEWKNIRFQLCLPERFGEWEDLVGFKQGELL